MTAPPPPPPLLKLPYTGSTAGEDAALPFTLTSADGVPYSFRLTAHMCTHSLYLQTATDIAATEGEVPVGSAQAVRDYVAYLQYRELREQLSVELRRQWDGVGLDVASSSPPEAHLLGPSVPTVTRPAPAQHHQQHLQLPVALGNPEDVWRSPFLFETRLLTASVLDDIGMDVEGAHADVTATAGGYGVRHLDCDRTYATHAEALRHWMTTGTGEEGGEAVVSAAAAGSGQQPRRDVRGGGGGGVSALSSARAAALAEATPVRGRTTTTTPPSSPTSSSSSSSSSVSSPSEASLAAYRVEAAAATASAGCCGCCGGALRPSLAEEPGYGAALAMEEQDGLLFLERVLLPHALRRAGGVGGGVTHHEATHPSSLTSALSAADAPPRVALAVHQQLRLLELVSVADFMGTQSLVELCASYLAAWLMDRTDEEVVQSFLAETTEVALPAAAATRSLPDVASVVSVPKYRPTGATSFQDPWLRPATPTELSTAAVAASVGVDLVGNVASAHPPPPGATFASSSSSTATPATRQTETKAAKKKKNAAASSRGNTGKGKQGAAAPSSVEGGEDDGEASATAGPAGGVHHDVLSGDQRLSVVRQIKKKGSIMIAPY